MIGCILSGFRPTARGIRNRGQFVDLSGQTLSVLLRLADAILSRADAGLDRVNARLQRTRDFQIRVGESDFLSFELAAAVAASFDFDV